MIINIFGSTGNIGVKTLDIIDKNFSNIDINLLCANNNVDKLIQQINLYSPKFVYLKNSSKITHLKKNIDSKVTILDFNELISYLNNSNSDLSILAISGYKSLNYFESILKNTSSLGLVSKETVVSAGHLFKKLNKTLRKKIYPLDSEHFSIFQNINYNYSKLRNITITASGGPFLGRKFNSLKNISFAKAANHPKWKMGYKNSIDSATMVNKCLELVEAHYLFDIPFEKIQILIHPESKIHSILHYQNYIYNMVAFHNDMAIPIYHFLNQKLNFDFKNDKFKISDNISLNFTNLKDEEFPIYKFFQELNKSDPSNIIKFNVANEYAVNAFKKKFIKYTDILNIITNIASLNIDYKLNNIKDIMNYHELLEIKIIEKFNYL